MQRNALLLTLLLGMVALPVADGQEPDQVLLQDAMNDVDLLLVGQSQRASERFATMDLVALHAEETPDDVVFRLQVRDLDAGSELAYLESSAYRIGFEHNGRIMGVEMARWTEAGSSGTWGSFQTYNPQEDSWTWQAQVGISQDEEANVMQAVVPRDLLHDPDGARPGPGRVLDGIWAEAMHMEFNPENIGSLFPEPTGFVDRMPDNGVGDQPLGFQYGVEERGTLRLASERPFRMSNGEATTFVFEVTISNIGDAAEQVGLGTDAVPTGWAIRFPEPSFSLAAGETRDVAVLVTVPFAHEHGSERTFTVEATSSDGASVGRVELGIVYTEIPQPSGHHPRLWIHSTPLGSNLIRQALAPLPGAEHAILMNAEPEWEADTDEPVQAQRGFVNGVVENTWHVQLSPLLGMGLDFDLDREGVVTIPISSATPMTDTEVFVWLYHWSTEDRQSYDGVTIARATVPAGDWAGGDTRTIEAPFTVSDEADLIGLRAYQGIYLRVVLRGDMAGPNGAADPYLEPGGTVDLPLFEYHDPLDELEGAFGLEIDIAGHPERLANPGDAVHFEVVVHNKDDERRHIDLSVEGNTADWVALSDERITLGGGESQRLGLTVTVPAGASDGELADLVLQATADDGTTALQRLRVVVDTDAQHEHAAPAAVESVQEAPGPAGLLIVASVLLAAVMRRPKP